MSGETGRWLVTAYYASGVKPPNRPGDKAMSVLCRSESVRDMEIEAFESRPDIGEVVVAPYGR